LHLELDGVETCLVDRRVDSTLVKEHAKQRGELLRGAVSQQRDPELLAGGRRLELFRCLDQLEVIKPCEALFRHRAGSYHGAGPSVLGLQENRVETVL
jgi:hypothetical protein